MNCSTFFFSSSIITIIGDQVLRTPSLGKYNAQLFEYNNLSFTGNRSRLGIYQYNYYLITAYMYRESASQPATVHSYQRTPLAQVTETYPLTQKSVD